MSTNSIEVHTSISNKPEAVLQYIADVRNRPLYLAPLKSITDIKGDPSGVGTTWKWVWVSLGMEFQGTARCLKHEPGKLYSFKTEGGIGSTWMYTTEAEGAGTRLTIAVEYDIPEQARSRVPVGAAAESLKKAEAERVLANLKVILDQ